MARRFNGALAAYDGFMETFSVLGIASITIAVGAALGWGDASALRTGTGTFFEVSAEFVKSHFVNSAGDISWYNTTTMLVGTVLSFGDNIFKFLRMRR